jgi:hypothetical protein
MGRTYSIGENEMHTKFIFSKPEWKGLRPRWEDIKMNRKWVHDTFFMGSCKHGNELSDSVKYGIFLDS